MTAPRSPGALLVWGVPAATLLHNLEEGLTVARYLPHVRRLAPERLRSTLPAVESIYIALVLATLVPIGLAVLTRRPASARWATYGLFAIAAVLLVNVAWHVGAVAVLRGYAPGVATAVVINLPVTIVALRRGGVSGWLSTRTLIVLLLGAVLLHGPIVAGAVVLLGAIS